MKILLLGANGQLGQAYQELSRTEAWPIGWELVSLNRNDCDLSSAPSLLSVLNQLKPDFIINAAAYTQVDLAEKDQDLCDAINHRAPAILAQYCKSHQIALIHFSSDYVYSGEGVEPHVESEKHQPLGHYGASKAKGDEVVMASAGDYLIFRTSWVYSHEGKNFVKTMLRLGSDRPELRVVCDQVGSPTYAPDLAQYALDALMQSMVKKVESGIFPSGVYHLTNSGYTSWADFAVAIFASARAQGELLATALKVERVVPIASSEYPTPAKRPLNSRLNLEKFTTVFGIKPRPWTEALKECLEKIGTQHHG
jgi:dTDP-4-dehydrorhamnose reductase